MLRSLLCSIVEQAAIARDSSGVVSPCYDVWVVVEFVCGELR